MALLLARSPKRAAALRRATKNGLRLLCAGRTLIACGRVRADRPVVLGQASLPWHEHPSDRRSGRDDRVDVGALADRAHDLTAARVWEILRELGKAGIVPLADKDYQGAGASVLISRTRDGTSPSHKSRPTARTPSSADPANMQTPSPRAGESSASSAAAPARSAILPRPSPSCRTTRSPADEKGSMKQGPADSSRPKVWVSAHPTPP